jgi:hypothetical protein
MAVSMIHNRFDLAEHLLPARSYKQISAIVNFSQLAKWSPLLLLPMSYLNDVVAQLVVRERSTRRLFALACNVALIQCTRSNSNTS